MALEQTIMGELKTAMLAKDEKSLRALRAIKAAIILAKTAEGSGGELKEEDEVKMLQKLVKQRKDSLAIYQQQKREDLALKEQEEIDVIEKFLPKQLSAEIERKGISDHSVNGRIIPRGYGKSDGRGHETTRRTCGRKNNQCNSEGTTLRQMSAPPRTHH